MVGDREMPEVGEAASLELCLVSTERVVEEVVADVAAKVAEQVADHLPCC